MWFLKMYRKTPHRNKNRGTSWTLPTGQTKVFRRVYCVNIGQNPFLRKRGWIFVICNDLVLFLQVRRITLLCTPFTVQRCSVYTKGTEKKRLRNPKTAHRNTNEPPNNPRSRTLLTSEIPYPHSSCPQGTVSLCTYRPEETLDLKSTSWPSVVTSKL